MLIKKKCSIYNNSISQLQLYVSILYRYKTWFLVEMTRIFVGSFTLLQMKSRYSKSTLKV